MKRVLVALAASVAVMAQAQYTAREWPEGPMKQRFVEVCGACHDINRIRVGYTPEGWLTVVRMMQNFDTPVPAVEWGAMQDYLIKNFPERARPPAVIVDGPAKVNIRLWDVPTQGSRPHDPIATRDGAIWWTGQLANKLGRVDPKTNTIREYTLKTPHTGPHGLAEDKDGNNWFTGNHIAAIGKLDPNTGITTEYKMPDPKAKDPHTINIAPDGMVWFTVQQGNFRRQGRSEERRGEAGNPADRALASLWTGDQFQRRAVVRSVRYQQDRTHRSADHGGHRSPAAERRLAAAPTLVRGRRHHLVHGFPPRHARPLRHQNRRRKGMGLAERTEIRALRHRLHQGRGLVQRGRCQAEHHRSLRSADREIPELGDPGRRRYRTQHGRDPGRQSGHREQPHQPGRADRDQIGTGARRA